MKRDIILDLYLFDLEGNIAAVVRNDDDFYEKNVVSTAILTLPDSTHSIVHVHNYLKSKGLRNYKIEFLPGIYLNTFDSEQNKEYLVLSFRVFLPEKTNISGDKENPNFLWMKSTEFINNPNLMPEFKQNNFQSLLNNHQLFYSGYYRDSDCSNTVLSLINHHG